MTKRPTVTPKMILEAAKIVASRIDNGIDAEDIAAVYSSYDCGYKLAKKLERRYGYADLSSQDVADLDSITSEVRCLLRTAVKAWFEQNNPQPPFPIGTTIKQGVIAGIFEHGYAEYLVKESGCTDDTRHLIIKFEDAELPLEV